MVDAMSGTAIKFCGITRAEDARVVAELGAMYVGCIFTDSRRRVRPGDAAAIFGAAPDARKVGVFGGESVDTILEAADAAALDVIQLHAGGDEEMMNKLRASFRGEIWSVVRVRERDDVAASMTAASGDAILLDTHSDSQLGGTGEGFDWEGAANAAREGRRDRRLIVAGGLTPENVADAIRALQPDVVDVSSGVESSPAVKDPARMRAFARAVETANGR